MRKLGDILLDRGLIKKEQLDKALDIQKTSNKYLGQILVAIGAITEDILTDIQASILGLKVVSTEKLKIHPKIIQFIPESIAIKYRIVPIYIEPNANQNILCMVTSEEPPTTVINKMSEKLNVPIKIFLATYSELETLLIKHYNKPKEIAENNLDVNTQEHKTQEHKVNTNQNKEIKLETQDLSTPEIKEDDEILTGSLIEDDGNEILSGDLIDESEINVPQEKKKISLPKIDLNLESTKDIEENIVPEKIPEDISLDLFDEIPEPSIKLETENNIPTLNIDTSHHADVNLEIELEEVQSTEKKEVKENKKLNFLEAFKAEDSYVFGNKPEEYISVEIGDDLEEEVEELDVNDVDLFDDVIIKEKEKTEEQKINEKPAIPTPKSTSKTKKDTTNSIDDDFPFALDNLSTPTSHKSTPPPKKEKKNPIKIKTPPPLNSNEAKIELPKDNDPQNVDKSAFPAPQIKRFKDESENETNPGTTQKISLNDKKVTDDWLKKNKDREIPDLDSIFGEEESFDNLNNKKIDKIILSKKLENLHDTLIDFLKSKKLKKDVINSFNNFFNELENNPSNIILVSILELIILGEKPNLDLLFNIILKNIENVNSKNK